MIKKLVTRILVLLGIWDEEEQFLKKNAGVRRGVSVKPSDNSEEVFPTDIDEDEDATYRVIQITTDHFSGGRKTESTFWKGNSAIALSMDHPPSNIFGADDLKHSEIEEGYVRFDYRFEYRDTNNNWVECKDPRVRLNTRMTEVERETDEYNRRTFPGDYLDDDQDDEDDPYPEDRFPENPEDWDD